MLTDIAIKSLKSKDKPYKVADRDGLYVSVAPTGTKTFRYDYRVNGRRETLTIGRYGKYGITLAAAREKLIDAKKLVDEGVSPAKEKKRAKAKAKSEGTFGELAQRWLAESEMSDSTRDMRRHIVDRDLIPALGNYTLREVTSEDVRQLCDKIKKRGAPSTALPASSSSSSTPSPICTASVSRIPPRRSIPGRSRVSGPATARSRRWRSGSSIACSKRSPPIRR